MQSATDSRPLWTLIVPVKELRLAKSRLTTVTEHDRASLALAFALDAVAAALSCSRVSRVYVVTNDSHADGFADLGARVLRDWPDAGLNPALEHAEKQIRAEREDVYVAAMASDLPAVTAEALTRAFSLAPEGRWFVADTGGLGTTLLAAGVSTRLTPEFGMGSRAAHRARGAVEITAAGLDPLRRDVDTEADLWDAVRLGVGTHTAGVLDDLGWLEPDRLA